MKEKKEYFKNNLVYANNRVKLHLDTKIRVDHNDTGKVIETGYYYGFNFHVDLKTLLKKISYRFPLTTIIYNVTGDDRKGDYLIPKKEWRYEVIGEMYSRKILTWNELVSEFDGFIKLTLLPRKYFNSKRKKVRVK